MASSVPDFPSSSSTTTTSSSSSSASLRKISEDAKLRPFLSPHFDPQQYIKSVMTEGTSEECFAGISRSIAEVNDEIKKYISQHKEDLMSGMQDVTVLADRYNTLSASSHRLHASIERLKTEALDTYALVSSRTAELERLHSANSMLRHLRQFVHAKAQLDHHLNVLSAGSGKDSSSTSLTVPPPSSSDGSVDIIATGGNLDIRHLATAAKILSELESLMQIPSLMEVSYVKTHSPSLNRFGHQLRVRAQDLLLSSLKERSQASVAASMQVFFNLHSLPPTLLLAIDTVIKSTIEASQACLDLELLIAAHPDLGGQGKAGTSARATSGSTSRGLVGRGGGNAAGAGLTTLPISPQLRVTMREVAHMWSTQVLEHAMQIQVLQRVVLKKEDPATHKRFVDVLSAQVAAASASNSSSSSSSPLPTSHPALASGRLLQLYWDRLASPLQDLLATKLKAYPLPSVRLYPYLRQACVEINQTLKTLERRDTAMDGQGAWVGGRLGGYGDGGSGGLGEALGADSFATLSGDFGSGGACLRDRRPQTPSLGAFHGEGVHKGISCQVLDLEGVVNLASVTTAAHTPTPPHQLLLLLLLHPLPLPLPLPPRYIVAISLALFTLHPLQTPTHAVILMQRLAQFKA